MNLLLFILFFLTIPVTSAHAYLDPGTGSYVFQIILATILGGAVGLKSYWGKIKNIFVKEKTNEKKTEEKSSRK